MTRVKRSLHARKKRRATLELTKGFRGEAHSNYRRAKEALLKADAYAYRDRRNRKRDFRRLWITRINAAARVNGMSYSQFMHGLCPRRDRARQKGARRHRRARRRHLPTFCRCRPRGVGCLTRPVPKPGPGHRPTALRAPLLKAQGRRPSAFPTRTDHRHHHDTDLDHHRLPEEPHLKALRRLHRRRERERSGTFLAEGEDLISAAELAGWHAVEGYRRRAPAGPGRAAAQAGFHEVEGELLAGVSTLGSGTRVLAVYEQRWSAPTGPLCVYLHALRDPGNVGTIIRSAHAFGASCVALGPGCADPLRAEGRAREHGRDLHRPAGPRAARWRSSPASCWG